MGSGETKDLPRIPELAAEYEFVRELGRGGTGVVYLARDRELGREVAIKVLRPSALRDEDALARLLREARTAARLQHPNIVMLLGARRLSRGELALFLQYVPGVTLKERIRTEGPLPVPEAEAILREMAAALGFAHRLRIVHRDVKPENIYLDRAVGISRLADFGIARVWDASSDLTLPGMAIGTPTYMSPEQVEGAALDGRSDLYSLGLVGWAMLTGRRPWDGEGMYSVIFKQRTEKLPSIREFRSDVPGHLRLGIERLLAKDPNDRWATAEAFSTALRGGAPLPSRTVHPVPVPLSDRLLSRRGRGTALPWTVRSVPRTASRIRRLDVSAVLAPARLAMDPAWPKLRATARGTAHRFVQCTRSAGVAALHASHDVRAEIEPRIRVASAEIRSRARAGFDAIPTEVRGFLLPAFLVGAAAVSLVVGGLSGAGEPDGVPPPMASIGSGGTGALVVGVPGDQPSASQGAVLTERLEARLRTRARRSWNETRAQVVRLWQAITTQMDHRGTSEASMTPGLPSQPSPQNARTTQGPL
jgi:serine/threonine protein kinase